MSRYCDHYACTKELLDRFLTAARDDDHPGMAVDELVNDLYPCTGLLHHEINHNWEDVHRCLTFDADEDLDFDCGDEPLMLCIHGGEWLLGGGRTMTLVRAVSCPRCARRWTAGQGLLPPDDAGAAQPKAWGVTPTRSGPRRRSRPSWDDFCSLREFYHKANAARLPVICTISH